MFKILLLKKGIKLMGLPTFKGLTTSVQLLYPVLFEKSRFLVHTIFTPFKSSRGRTFDFKGKYPKTQMCGFTFSKKNLAQKPKSDE